MALTQPEQDPKIPGQSPTQPNKGPEPNRGQPVSDPKYGNHGEPEQNTNPQPALNPTHPGQDPETTGVPPKTPGPAL